jgi:hypothetical protein
MEKDNSIGIKAETKENEFDTVVKFSKPYTFEGDTYTEIDLSGMEHMTAQDMIDAEKYLNRSGVFSPIPEVSVKYVCFIASKAAKQPIEFFEQLPPREATKVKNKVTSFFYGEE